MTASETLQAAWKALIADSRAIPGVYERRIFAKSDRSLFAGIRHPSGALQLFLYVKPDLLRNWENVDTRGFTLHADLSVMVGGLVRVRLEATQAAFSDLFGRLCSDAVNAVLAASDDSSALEAMKICVDHWRRFVGRAGLDGLSDEAQVGLYGELLFLRKLLAAGCPARRGLEAWKGPLGGNQDFVFGDVAVEVKSTVANVDTCITVANERQLDDTGLKLLALCHISLDRREHTSGTLPKLVQELADTFGDALSVEFVDRLLAAGYHELHAGRYQRYGYAERSLSYFKVFKDFPRIIPSDLQPGVQEVAYRVDLLGASACRLRQDEVLYKII